MQASKKPDIICFGDSLTVGYQSPTPDVPEYRETPYAVNFYRHECHHTHPRCGQWRVWRADS